MSFSKRILKASASARGLALWASVCLFMGAWNTYSLRPGSDSVLPGLANASIALLLYLAGLGFLVGGGIVAFRKRDAVAGWILFLGFALGGAMAGVVQKEPESFYSVSAGVFASLILALASLAQSTKNEPA